MSRIRPIARRLAGPAALAALTLVTGCMHPGHMDRARTGPLYVPANHLAEPSLGGIRRVVVLPVWTGAVAPEETGFEMDAIVVAALQHHQRFEVVALSRDVAWQRFRAQAFSSAGALPHNFMATLAREYAADAVLFVDLTVYRPYQPLGLGLRAKLATMDGSRLVWTFDDLFSADDSRVAQSARNHFLDLDRSVPADMTHGVLQSPSRFATYATTAMFSTLPPVLPPPPKKAAQPVGD